nr:hypothetical protein [Tanacetum cinerariifolium]
MPPLKPKKTQTPRKPKRKTTKVPQPSESTDIVVDEAVHKEGGDSLVRATTTASSLKAEQDSGNIDKTQTKEKSNEPSSQRTSSDDGPRRQDTMGDTSAHTSKGMEVVGEEEVVEVVTTAKMIIDVVDAEQVTTVIADIPVSAPETIVTTTLTITAESTTINVEDKGRGKEKLIEEPEMLKKRKHQIRADEELAKKLQAKMQAEIDKEDRLARVRESSKEQEANDALINTSNNI